MHVPHEPHPTELKAIISSVYYLEHEARKAGFTEISLMFRKTIGDIDQWIDANHLDKSLYYHEVTNSDLYKILKIMDRLAVVQRFDVDSILAAIEAYDRSVSRG